MARDTPNLADYGLDWAGAHVNQALGYEDAKTELDRAYGSVFRQAIGADAYNKLSALNPAPSAASLKSLAVRTGLDPNYTPQGIAGRYAHEIAAFAPSALIPGGEAGFLSKLGSTVLPAVASETAGHAVQGTAYEPWARVLGAGFGGLTQTTGTKLAQPLYKGGQQDMAAKMLRDAASDPDAALARARAAQAATPVGRATGENIPGSKPTLSQVTRDPGLVGAETEYQTSNAVQHSQRMNAQSEAQSNALAGVQQGGDSTNVSDLITNHLNQIDQQHEAKLQAALKTHATEQQAHAQGVQQMETAARTQAGEVARKGRAGDPRRQSEESDRRFDGDGSRQGEGALEGGRPGQEDRCAVEQHSRPGAQHHAQHRQAEAPRRRRGQDTQRERQSPQEMGEV